MSARTARSVFGLCCWALLGFSACVIKLSDKNAPLPNGGVTGPAADCTQLTPLPPGGPGTGDAKEKFVGRYELEDPGRARFDWSGNYVSARFEGTEVSVGIEAPVPMVFTAVIDGQEPIKFLVDATRSSYLVASGLPAGVHEVTVHRDSEPLFGACAFTGFNFGAGKILPPTERPRRIEYIGDSITCGYGNEGINATCPYDVPADPSNPNGDRVPITENQYLAYGSIAARALFADAVTLCYSGKGVYQNYREGQIGEGAAAGPANAKPDPDAKTVVPQYYERTLASEPNSPKWDFTKEPEPQVVVINLGTNDFTRDVDQDSNADGIDLAKFQQAYYDFVGVVRQRRPNAHIFLLLPPMVTDKFPLDEARSDFRNVLNQIVSTRNQNGDGKVYFAELVEMGVRYGLGCDYHPNLEVHRIMADQIIGAIRSKTCW